MLRRALIVWTLAGALSCVRDDWTYPASAREAGTPSDAADVTDVPPTDVPPTDVPITDVPITDVPPTDVPPTDVPSIDVPPTDVPPTDVPPTDVPPADVPPADVRPTDSGGPCPVGMVLIPAGQFQMGDSTGVEPLALPVHGVRLSAFCLDVAEVTVDAYHGCPTATCTSPGIQPTCNWNVAGRGGHPVNCVTFAQAQTYCASRSGATLPTEAQWEYAARGVDGRPYPWGDAAPASQLCWSGGGTVQPNTCAGRAFPASGPFGLFDMAGGVSEMTLDWYGPYFGNASSFEMDPPGPASGPGRIIRGGSWRSTSANDVRVYSRELMDAAYATAVGFRCARAAP